MFAKMVMKNPVLMIGILFMVIFLFTLRDKGFFSSRQDKLRATSCTGVTVMLAKRIPKNWKLSCDRNNLFVDIEKDFHPGTFKTVRDFRAALYRDMANDLMFVSKNSPGDSLSRVLVVRMQLTSRKLIINAVTEGKYLSSMSTLSSKDGIAEHLKSTVHVKETLKE